MKLSPKLILFFFITFSLNVKAQIVDTLIDQGKFKLHFKITIGKGTLILFESGGALDIKQWDSITNPVSKITGATLITYDREGFGNSGIDTTNYTIENEIIGLENSISKLGYGELPMILVCHSLGAFYSRVYASRHTKLIRGIIMLDPRIPSQADAEFARIVAKSLDKKMRLENLSLYYLLTTMSDKSEYVSNTKLKNGLPILDIMAENGPFDSEKDNIRFKADQRLFLREGNNRIMIFAKSSSHNIPKSNPSVVIKTIISFYRNHK